MEELQFFDYVFNDFKVHLANYVDEFGILQTSLNSLKQFVTDNVAVIEVIETGRPPILFSHSSIVPYGPGDPNQAPEGTEFRIIKVIPASVDEDQDQMNRFYVKEYRNIRTLHNKTSTELQKLGVYIDKHFKNNTNPDIDKHIADYHKFLDIHRQKMDYYTHVIKYKHRLVTHETK